MASPPGGGCVIRLNSSALRRAALLAIPSPFSQTHFGHLLARPHFSATLQSEAGQGWPLTCHWRPPGWLMGSGWAAVVEDCGLQVGDQVTLLPPDPPGCETPQLRFRVERDGVPYCPPVVKQERGSSPAPESPMASSLTNKPTGQQAGRVEPGYVRELCSTDLAAGFRISPTNGGPFFDPLLGREDMAQLQMVDKAGQVWDFRPRRHLNGWQFRVGWQDFREAHRLRVGDALEFHLPNGGGPLRVTVRRSGSLKSGPKRSPPSATTSPPPPVATTAPRKRKADLVTPERSTKAFVGNRALPVKVKRDNEGWAAIGPWIMEDLLGRNQGDRRYMAVGQEYGPEDGQRWWVPGFIGIRTSSENETSTPWTRSYVGRYDAMVWDRQKAVLVYAGNFDSVLEAALWFDEVSLACYGCATANTNFQVDEHARQRFASTMKGGGQMVMIGLQLLRKEDALNWKAVLGAPEEWDEWRDNVRALITSLRTPETLPDLVQRLAQAMQWFLQHLPEVILLPYWHGPRFQRLIEDVGLCNKMGLKTDHYYPCQRECHTCLLNLKGADTGKGNLHGQGSAEALIRVIERELISFAAVEDLAAGGSGVAAAAAEQQELYQCEAQTLQRLAQAEKQSKRAQKGAKAKAKAKAATARRTREAGSLLAELLPPAAPPAPVPTPAEAEDGLLPSLPERHTPALPPGLTVVVVGAGVGGLAAAAALRQRGARVTVLEARAGLGGRAHSAALGGRAVDVGAARLSAPGPRTPATPLWEWAQRQGLVGETVSHDLAGCEWYDGDLQPMALEVAEKAQAACETVLGELREASEAVRRDLSVLAAANPLLERCAPDATVRSMVLAYLGDVYGAPLPALSLKGSTRSCCEGDQSLVPGGMARLVEALAAPLDPAEDVRLEREVVAVRLPPRGPVEVTARAGDAVEQYWADAVVVAVPLGVLKHGAVAFEPPLPALKRQAIASLAVGTAIHIALIFPSLFWPPEPHFLRPVAGRYTFLNYHSLGLPHVLCASVRPPYQVEVEALCDEEVVQDVCGVLRTMFGTAAVDPLEYKVTRWGQDAYSRGSHTYVPTSAHRADCEAIGMPVSGDPEIDRRIERGGGTSHPLVRLYFAGDAADHHHPGTLHGAYCSGRRAARRVADWWRRHGTALLAEKRRAGGAKAARAAPPSPSPGPEDDDEEEDEEAEEEAGPPPEDEGGAVSQVWLSDDGDLDVELEVEAPMDVDATPADGSPTPSAGEPVQSSPPASEG